MPSYIIFTAKRWDFCAPPPPPCCFFRLNSPFMSNFSMHTEQKVKVSWHCGMLSYPLPTQAAVLTKSL